MYGWKKIAVAGVGSRGEWWTRALARRYSDRLRIVGLCDGNAGRNQLLKGKLAEFGQDPALYAAADFTRMIAETRPDAVLIAVPDKDHAEYAVAAMRAGVDVLIEKPVAASVEQTRQILAARQATGRRAVVAFNMRWIPAVTQLKDLLMAGEIGEVVSVTMQWLLDTSHGADYFRRWHRNLANSGGLLVHKSTHHFDSLHWLVGSTPSAVFARGARRFYTPQIADQLGLQGRGERCLDCPVAAKCPYRLDLRADPNLNAMYLANEQFDGYQRDRCIFSPTIDIPDSVSLSARYASGAMMTYSLQAFSPWEGFNLAIDGTRGRIEHRQSPEGMTTRVMPLRGPARQIQPWAGEGQHGGSDDLLIAALFSGEPVEDRWGRLADERAGAWSALTGMAANRSIAEGREIQLADLAPELFASGAAAG